MKLWYVTVEYTGFVFANDESDACDAADDIVQDEDPSDTSAVEVTHVNASRITGGFEPNYRPYTSADDDEIQEVIDTEFPPDDAGLDPDNVTVAVWLRYLKYQHEQAEAKAETERRQQKLDL